MVENCIFVLRDLLHNVVVTKQKTAKRKTANVKRRITILYTTPAEHISR
jgi:hypothetical protein